MIAIALVALLLMGGLLLLVRPAAAAVTAGATVALVNAGQTVRDGSTAVPLFGINATATAPGDQLQQITVSFTGTGFVPGNTGTLLPLDQNPDRSGVALYADTGSVPRALDATDTGVTANAVSWTGSSATLGYAEPFPTVPAGAFEWILVLRTSSNAAAFTAGTPITATIPAGGIAFTGGVTQPAAAVAANPLTVAPTSVADLIAPQAWVGPIQDPVNASAVLGVRIADGGIPTNSGIHDSLTQVVVQIIDVSLTFNAASLRAPSTDPATSGIGLYRDSNGNGVWDPADTKVLLSSITVNCVVPLDVEDVCLMPSAEALPHALSAGYSYFVVVRTNAMGSGDVFRFEVLRGQIVVTGVLPGDAARLTPLGVGASSRLLGDNTPPCVTMACGQPFDIHWANPTGSLYLFPADRILYFSHGMGATPVPGQVVLSANDGESGLFQAVFSNEPSLAGSPGPAALSGSGVDVTVRGSYQFNSASTAASSPAFVTVYDAVGNHATAPFVAYVLDPTNPLIVPAPGWNNLPSGSFYVNATGTLWFSPWIVGRQTVDLTVDLSDSISGLKNATASAAPSLAGGPFYAQPVNLGGVNAFPGWTATYAFDATSTPASGPITVTACDMVANCASRSFGLALDATPPVVTISSPLTGAVLSGRVIVSAKATDVGSGIAGPLQVEVLGQTGFMDMVWNGTAWVWPISTPLFPDGAYRIVVQAFDHVGNQGAAVVDVFFHNAATSSAPVIAFVSPGAGALISGITDIRVSVSDPFGIVSVVLSSGSASYAMARLGNGVYAFAFDTRTVTTGDVTLTVTATDSLGASTSATLALHVDNTPPSITLGSASSDRGAITLRATVTDSPAGVASVSFIVDGKTYAAIADGQGGYSVTIWTSVSENGVHSYEVVAVDRVGNTATSSGTFPVNNPSDAYAALLAFAPLGIFLVLVVALVLGLILMRRRKPEAAEPKKESKEEPKKEL